MSSFFKTSHNQDFHRGHSPSWNFINKQCWVTAQWIQFGYFLVPFLQTVDTSIQELTIVNKGFRNSESKQGVSPFFKRPIIILASVSILIRVFSRVGYYCSCEVGGFPGFTFTAQPAVHKRLTCFRWNSLLALLPWCVQRTEIEGAWAS